MGSRRLIPSASRGLGTLWNGYKLKFHGFSGGYLACKLVVKIRRKSLLGSEGIPRLARKAQVLSVRFYPLAVLLWPVPDLAGQNVVCNVLIRPKATAGGVAS